MALSTWKTATSGSWTSSSNWTTGQIRPRSPTTYSSRLPGTYTVSALSQIAARSITLNDASATLTATNSLSLGGLLSINAGTFLVNGTTIKGGTIAVGAGTFLVNAGTFDTMAYQGTLNLGASAHYVQV